MSDLVTRIESIHNKVQQMITDRRKLLSENDELKGTVLQLSKELNVKESRIKNINTELETREKQQASANKNMQVKVELDNYMSEINACIEMVNELV